ncbi:MAG TPA: EAL domain-containing protein [Anaeromyxobacter sp.]
MKRKILTALLLLFACSAAGSVMALVFIKSTTDELRRLSELHRIEEMRQNLIVAIQEAQADLFTVNTSLGQKVDVITENIFTLERSAAACAQCHHTPEISGRLDGVRALISDYEAALSHYMTASADSARIGKLKLEAASLAAELLRRTEEMAVEPARRSEERAVAAMHRFDQARAILTLTLALTLVVAIAIAVRLATSITRPVEALVRATRAIAQGELGFAIEVKDDRTELGELAGHFNSMSAALRDGYAALQNEIEERKRAEARLLYDAFHDALTGLPNRALFLDRLQHVIEAGRRHAEQVYAVLFLDLDRFKVINDTLGHLVGDHLLVAVGERLAECLRPGDTVARLGGDEFGILLDRIGDPPDALQVADRIQKALVKAVDVDGHEIFVTTSIGVALRSERYQRPEQVLRDADIAMYQAKVKGKACCEIFDAEMHGSVVDRLQLEADLRRAVEHGEEFLLHYQPIVALRTGKLIGVEALVRWDKAGRGLLPAGEFISLAEESGVVVPMGDWVVRTACAQLRIWQEQVPALAGVTLSINVSGRQFRRPEFVEGFWGTVRDAGVDPRAVAIEVTEAVIMDDVEASAAKLGRLRELGIQIHVDDFGTGYSSLSYLHRFPISAVKIDRSFVSGLPDHHESEEVIKAIVSIAESLDFDVIAEGVETSTQAERLEELRCRYAQGFLLSKPLPASEVEAWAATWKARSVA